MMRTAASKAVLLAAAVLFTGATTVNCSKKSSGSDTVGSVGMAVVLSPGVNVNSVGYSITGGTPPITPINGSINVTGNSASVSLLVSGIPAGVGYLLTLNATSTDGLTTCAGTANFDVIANQTTGVSVALQCRGPGATGSVLVNGRFDNCPVGSVTASPLQTGVGGPISLSAVATDKDNDTLTFAWTSSSAIGTFNPANAAASTFTCGSAGAAVLTVTVSDGLCTATQTVSVTCAAGTGTGGAVGTGGAGTGGAVGTGGAGTGGAGTGGAVSTGGAGTGGAVSTGGAGTGGAGTGGAVSTGGAGTGGAGTGGAGGMSTGPVCPMEIGSVACNTCTNNFCDPSTDGCCGLTNPADVALCVTAATCFRDKACTLGGDPTNCFCGLSGANCNTAPSGVCIPEIQAAAKSTDPGTILARFVNGTFPIGRAVNLYTCRSTVCPAECPAP